MLPTPVLCLYVKFIFPFEMNDNYRYCGAYHFYANVYNTQCTCKLYTVGI